MRPLRHAVPLALTAVALLAAGCGDDDDGDDKAQTTTPTAAAPPASAAQGDTAGGLTEAPQGLSPKASSPRGFTPKAAGATSYCSPTGDYCVGVRKASGATLLSIASLAFSGNYRLCVTGPPGRGCKSFRLKRSGQMWISAVRFAAPSRGRYSATWFYGGNRLGRPLGFSA